MQQQTIPAGANPVVHIDRVHGDLRVAGWDRPEIMAKASGDSLSMNTANEQVIIACDEDLIVYLPRPAILSIHSVAGDASLQALQGPVTLGPIAGDLTIHDLGAVQLGDVSGDVSLRNIGPLNGESISGDFVLRAANGPCALVEIGGDASIRDVNGPVTIETVGSDLYLREAQGPVNVKAGADVTLFLNPLPGMVYDVSAGDDLILRMPPEACVVLNLTGGAPDSIHVDYPGVEIPEDLENVEVTLGDAGENCARMVLVAGDDLLVTSQEDAWQSAADFGVGMSDRDEWGLPNFPLPPDFSERINQRVREAMERSRVHMEAATRRAESMGRRAGIKVEAAMRRAEAKARAAEIRARRGQVNMNIGRWNWDLSPRGPVASGQPVSDEERLAILKMLQEKKISLEQAEKLLAALEGK
jgi:hypothetical protein